MELDIKYDHTKTSLHECLGISDERNEELSKLLRLFYAQATKDKMDLSEVVAGVSVLAESHAELLLVIFITGTEWQKQISKKMGAKP